MRNSTILAGSVILTVGLFMCGMPQAVWAAETAESVQADASAPFHTILKDYTVKQIHSAAYDVLFDELMLAKVKSDDCNCTSNKADLLTGRIIAASADGITFVLRVHYLDENSCGLWIHAAQESDVPADFKKYCQLIYDRTLQALVKMRAENDDADVVEDEKMEFEGQYKMAIEQIYKIINDTANAVRLGHNTSTRNRFTVAGNFISGNAQFSYKAYMVADDKLKFRFYANSRSTAEGQRYIYDTIYKEFQQQIKLQQSK